MGLDPEAGVPYLLQLLGHRAGAERLAGHSPEVIKTRTMALCRQMLLNRYQRHPLVLVMEDLHWIDPLSEELCVALVERLVAVPLLFLVTYRPGYQPPWIAQSYVTQLALHPLSLEDSLTVVRTVHTTAQGTDPVVQDILAKAEGNPLFLEEAYAYRYFKRYCIASPSGAPLQTPLDILASPASDVGAPKPAGGPLSHRRAARRGAASRGLDRWLRMGDAAAARMLWDEALGTAGSEKLSGGAISIKRIITLRPGP